MIGNVGFRLTKSVKTFLDSDSDEITVPSKALKEIKVRWHLKQSGRVLLTSCSKVKRLASFSYIINWPKEILEFEPEKFFKNVS